MIKELECTKDVMHTAIAQQQPPASFPPHSHAELAAVWCLTFLWPIGSAVLPVSPQLLVPPASLLVGEADKSLMWCKCCLATTRASLCYHTTLTLNPKYISIPVTRKKIVSIEAKNKTLTAYI